MDITGNSAAAAEAVVRRARPADAAAIEQVRVAGWQTAYRGIVDDSYLDAMRPDPHRFVEPLRDQRTVAHYVATTRPDPHRCGEPLCGDRGVADTFAEAGGEVVGWSCVGPARDPDAPAAAREVYACYVRPARWRGGIGAKLLRAALAPVPESAPVLLWVLKDNAGAREFYARHGFAPDGAERAIERAQPVGVAPREIRCVRTAGRGAA